MRLESYPEFAILADLVLECVVGYDLTQLAFPFSIQDFEQCPLLLELFASPRMFVESGGMLIPSVCYLT